MTLSSKIWSFKDQNFKVFKFWKCKYWSFENQSPENLKIGALKIEENNFHEDLKIKRLKNLKIWTI